MRERYFTCLPETVDLRGPRLEPLRVYAKRGMHDAAVFCACLWRSDSVFRGRSTPRAATPGAGRRAVILGFRVGFGRDSL